MLWKSDFCSWNSSLCKDMEPCGSAGESQRVPLIAALETCILIQETEKAEDKLH